MTQPPEVREALEVLRLRALAEGHGDYRLRDDRVAEVNSAAAVLTAHIDTLRAEVERRHTDAESLRFAAEWLTGNLALHEISGWGARHALRAEAKRLEQSQ